MINKDKLEEIGKYILSGMTEKESCILSDTSFSQLQTLKEKNEEVRNYIDKKKIRFKFNHLNEIQANKSEKNSQWILEKLRPEEFGTKAKNSEQTTINVISSIIKQIQYDNEPIINISRGSRQEPKPDEGNTDRRIRIAEILE